MRADGLPTAYDLGMLAPDWIFDAACADIVDDRMWFPHKGGTTRPAKAVCAGCPVRLACLEYALANQERHGIWGGLSEWERRKLEVRATRPDLRPVTAVAPLDPVVCCAVGDCRQPFTSLRGFHSHRAWRHGDRRRRAS